MSIPQSRITKRCSRLIAAGVIVVAWSLTTPMPAVAAIYRIIGDTESLTHDGSTGINRTLVGESYNQTDGLFVADAIGGASTIQPDPTRITRIEIHSTAQAGFAAARTSANSAFRRNFPYAPPENGDFELYRGNAQAEVTLTDVIIAGPTATVTTSFNMHISGLLEAGADPYLNGSGDPRLQSAATASIQFFMEGNNVGEGYMQRSSSSALLSSGLLSGFTGNNVVTTSTFTVPTNTPLTLKFVLASQATSLLYLSDSGNTVANANFSNTLTFVTNGPVFNLGTGYSASSLSGGIIGNQFVPVPEPATITLAILGAVGLLVCKRRSRAAMR